MLCYYVLRVCLDTLLDMVEARMRLLSLEIKKIERIFPDVLLPNGWNLKYF